MRVSFAAIVTIVAALPMIAYAAPRLSDVEYVRAARCAALAEVPAIKADQEDMAWLVQVVDDQSRGRQPIIAQKVKEDRRAIARAAKGDLSEASLLGLKTKRDQACEGFEKLSAQL